MIVTTPGLERAISGVIFHDETIREMILPGVGCAVQPSVSQVADATFEDPAMEIWGGRDANVARAQHALALRARGNAAARRGEYSTATEES